MPAPRRAAPVAAISPAATAPTEAERADARARLLEALPRIELESTLKISDQVLGNSSVPEQLRAVVQRIPDLWQIVRVGTAAFRLLLHSQAAQQATTMQLCNVVLEIVSALEAEVANTAHSLESDIAKAVASAAAEAVAQLDVVERQLEYLCQNGFSERLQTVGPEQAFPPWHDSDAYSCLLGKNSAPVLLVWPPHVRQCVLLLMGGIERRPGSVKRAFKSVLPIGGLGLDAEVAAVSARSAARKKDGTDLFMTKDELMIVATLYQALARCVVTVGDELQWPPSARLLRASE